MWRLSRAGLAEKWPLFVGATLSVCLGVALVQSSLLLLISAATYDAPPGLSEAERMSYADGASAAVSMLGITLGFAFFLAVFIISSTFGFTVAQRRRDLALLRLTGASRGQVGRMLFGEAVLLGVVGVLLGVPAGLGMMAAQGAMLRAMGFVPPDFAAQWRDWILFVSAGTGLLLALSGVVAAARRAGRVRPLEALRDSGAGARVMTAGRWIGGLIFLAGAVALMILTPVGGVGGGAALAANVPLCAAVALAAFAPLLVPGIAALLPVRFGGTTGPLAWAALRDDRRRSGAVAAPVIVLAALVLGQAGALTSFAAAGVTVQRERTRADLVVESAGELPRVAGIAVASREVSVPASITTGRGEDRETEAGTALVIDPAAYASVHSVSLDGLRRGAVATGPAGFYDVGSTIGVRLPGADLGELPVAAREPESLAGGAELLLTRDMVPAEMLAAAPARTFVQLEPGADRAAVTAALAGAGTVRELADVLDEDAAAQGGTTTKIMLAILGLGALYALIGTVNSVVIGAAARRREFAALRATGLTRAQVMHVALRESVLVTVAGLVLGGIGALMTWMAVLAGTSELGAATLEVPWTLAAMLAVVALAVTGLTTLITTWSATRPAPVSLLGARE